MSIFGFGKKGKAAEEEANTFVRKSAVSKALIDDFGDKFDEIDTKDIMKNVSAVNNYGVEPKKDKIDEQELVVNNVDQNLINETKKDEDSLRKTVDSLRKPVDFASIDSEIDGLLKSTNMKVDDILPPDESNAIDGYVNKHFSEEGQIIDKKVTVDQSQLDAMLKEIGLTPDAKPDPITSSKPAVSLKEKSDDALFTSNSKPTLSANVIKNDAANVVKNDNANIVSAEKKVEPTEEKKEFSTIMSLAISRPIAVAYDLKDRYEKEPFERLDIHANNQDLINYVNERPNTKYLDASDCQSITDYSIISRLNDLEELDLSGSPNLSDVSFLNNLKSLRVLNLGATAIESLEGFPTLPNLEVLNLKMNRIKNLSGIESCPNVHELVLWGCTSLDHIDELADFTELRALDLDSCNALRNINSVVNMKKLSYLNLNFTRIEDLSPIRNLTNLEIFTMDFCPLALSEQNLACFDNLVKMKFLGLRNRVIRNLEHFRNMTEMAELELSGNAINDLRPLENMTKLQILNLSTNPSLTDLSPLHKMKKLKKLIVSGAKSGKTITVAMLIEDISVVKELDSLEVFESNFNKKLKDISPLQYCQKLEEVDFNDCFGIADVMPLRFCKNLKEIYLENCTQVRDLSFVKYLTKLEKITLAKTSAERLLISDWTTLLDLKDLKDGDGTLPIHKAIINSIKFRKKISKIAKKTIKEEN